ncbi:MAG: N-acetylmuramoyl-L-alanine amidase family protein [Tissierellaceae bacterium]|nr:N-acetylmuramoyl-L-alanine amidase family protein [Tissierellaceae bacterium]
MEKKTAILIFTIMLIIFSQFVYADSGRIQINMDGVKVSVRQVPIIMDGKTIDTEFPSFVHVDRTLVPIRFVAENYGAEVDWDEKTSTAIINYDSKEARFTIDSNIAYINGEKIVLDKNAIPKLVSYEDKGARTMVPLRIVTETFGYEVGWDEKENVPYINSEVDANEEASSEGLAIVDNIFATTGSTSSNKIVVNSDKSLEYTTMFLENSNKLVVDIENALLSLPNTLDRPGAVEVEDEIIERIQYSQFSYEPSITRVVVTLERYETYDISSSNDGTGLVISFGGNKIGPIIIEEIDGKQAIVVEGAGYGKMNFIKLRNPERIVIDFLDSTLLGDTYYSYNYDLGFIKGIRVSQFTADNNYSSDDKIVRVVLDIKDGITDPSVKIDNLGDNIAIYPEKSLWENIDYIVDGENSIFTIENLGLTNYSVDMDTSSKNMVVTIPAVHTDLSEGTIIIKDNLINKVDVEKDGENIVLNISFGVSVDYALLSKAVDSKIILSLKKNTNIDNTNRIIVIDAGHGGKDPGATSVSKRYEKDFNLAMALKLDKKLRELGYNTIMTRNTDVFVDLYERAGIANDANADLFVSIHGNSHTSKTHAGIQVLYCPAFNSDFKEVDQHPFAKAMMTALLEGTGAIDKGIIQRPNLVVLRETKMPAVLVEAGFLSNSAEEKLLFTESYQNKIIDSIVKGIENYLEMN